MDVGSSAVMFNCSTAVTCTSNDGCMNGVVDVTWMKDGEIPDVMADSTYMFPNSTVDIMQADANSSVPVSFVLRTSGAVLFSHNGSYQCDLSLNDSLMPMSSSLQSLTVQCKSTC